MERRVESPQEARDYLARTIMGWELTKRRHPCEADYKLLYDQDPESERVSTIRRYEWRPLQDREDYRSLLNTAPPGEHPAIRQLVQRFGNDELLSSG